LLPFERGAESVGLGSNRTFAARTTKVAFGPSLPSERRPIPTQGGSSLMHGYAAGVGLRTGIDAAALTRRSIMSTGPESLWRRSDSHLLNHESSFFDFRFFSI